LRIVLYCAVHGVFLNLQYVGADAIIVSGADALSRRSDVTDCQLNPAIFGKLCQGFGEVQVDRFATGASAQFVRGRRLPYWGLWADGLAAGVDSLSADWRGVFNYAFPPVHLVGGVLRLVAEQRVQVLLIAPEWPSQWWWPLMQSMVSMVVDLRKVADGQPLFLATKAGGLLHPLGPGFADPSAVQWVAVYIRGV
jgi:hypothetical protein